MSRAGRTRREGPSSGEGAASSRHHGAPRGSNKHGHLPARPRTRKTLSELCVTWRYRLPLRVLPLWTVVRTQPHSRHLSIRSPEASTPEQPGNRTTRRCSARGAKRGCGRRGGHTFKANGGDANNAVAAGKGGLLLSHRCSAGVCSAARGALYILLPHWVSCDLPLLHYCPCC
jgi:hypothetical protein